MSSSSDPWPPDVREDYRYATVRLLTLEVDRVSHLLLGCVELLPNEIPPPEPIGPDRKSARPWRLTHSLRVLPAADALAWYASALTGDLVVPRTSHRVEHRSLGAEPLLGRLVVARNPPFAGAWHGEARLARMVPLEDLPRPVRELVDGGVADGGWIDPVLPPPVRDAVRRWVADRVHFDLLGSDDYLGGMVLVAPNPVLRSLYERLGGPDPHGNETIELRAIPRGGADMSTLLVRVAEERPDGLSWVRETGLDDLGRAVIRLDGRADATSLVLQCSRRGPLVVHDANVFFRGVSVSSQIMDEGTPVPVPPRRRGEPGTLQSVRPASSRLGQAGASAAPVGATDRLLALRRRRDLRPGLSDGPAGPGLDEYLPIDREETVALIRGLVAAARRRVILVDPFLDYRDLLDFASAVQEPGCRIGALTEPDGKRWRSPDLADKGLPLGDLMLSAIETLNGLLRLPPDRQIDVRMTMDTRPYHDRFLVVDDVVWHVGHSFGALGDGKVAMVTRLRVPVPVVAMIEEDMARGERFASAWEEIQRRAVEPPGGWGWP